jgi:hypothetical protein
LIRFVPGCEFRGVVLFLLFDPSQFPTLEKSDVGIITPSKHRFLLVAPSSTTASASVTATTTVAASVAATASAAFTRTRLVYDDIAAHEILAVEGLDNAGRFFIVIDFNEGETTGLSSVAVLD